MSDKKRKTFFHLFFSRAKNSRFITSAGPPKGRTAIVVNVPTLGLLQVMPFLPDADLGHMMQDHHVTAPDVLSLVTPLSTNLAQHLFDFGD
jgi:hypothetical protein